MAEVTHSAAAAEDVSDNNHHEEDEDEAGQQLPPSLIIPIKPSPDNEDNQFVEIFPEELPNISVSLLKEVLRDEEADSSLWATTALQYMQQKQARESLAILQEAVEHYNAAATGSHGVSSNSNSSRLPNSKRVRLLAATGIAHLAAAAASSGKKKGENDDENGGGGDVCDGGGRRKLLRLLLLPPSRRVMRRRPVFLLPIAIELFGVKKETLKKSVLLLNKSKQETTDGPKQAVRGPF